jgi:hypothetical protein
MKKHGARDSLMDNITAELKKDAEDINGDLIDRCIDGLYAMEGRAPPKLNEEALFAAARTVRSRAAWRRRNRLALRERKTRLTRRAVRGVWAACCVFLFLLSANYVSTLITGSCLPSKVGIKICCGTTYCLCGPAKAEEGNPAHSE